MDKTYTKLSALVDQDFTVKSVAGYKWKMWSPVDKRMVSRDTYAEGFSKKYEVETDKGWLDLGSGQIGSLLETTFKQGKADLIDKTFHVKSNGKTGMEIRYYFDVLNTGSLTPTEKTQAQPVEASEPEFNPEDIPF